MTLAIPTYIRATLEISSIYPRAFRGVAGASSRNLFKNSPEAGGRHLFSENLKDKLIGVAGAGTDAKPMPNPGGAGLVSRKLFKGHKLQAIGDTPRQIEGGGDADGDGVMDHLRDEEADIVLYGADVPDSELRKVVGISDKNPKAFDGAAGLTSREVFKVMEAALVSVECDSEEHKLGQARFGGELGEMLGERKLEYEVQKLAPDKYKDAAGLTSKVVTAVTMGDDERRQEGHAADESRVAATRTFTIRPTFKCLTRRRITTRRASPHWSPTRRMMRITG